MPGKDNAKPTPDRELEKIKTVLSSLEGAGTTRRETGLTGR